jgi:hypothetical protein
MRITVLWEDSRGVETKGFGPHKLLVACVADKLGRDRQEIDRVISSVAKKGVGNVINALQKNLTKLTKTGLVFAVIDRDKAREIWKPATPPPDCMTAIRKRIAEDVASDKYDLVFLVQNMESLVNACDARARLRFGGRKPTPDQRDRVLGKAASDAPTTPRPNVLSTCPSFARLVDRVGDVLSRLLG